MIFVVDRSQGDGLVFQSWVALKRPTHQAQELLLWFCSRRERKVFLQSSGHGSSECQESELDKGKVEIRSGGSSDLSLAVKKLKLIGLFMNSAF